MTTIPTFDLGDTIRVGNQTGSGRAPFTTIAGVVANPDKVLLTVTRPDKTAQYYGWPTPWPGMTEANGTVVTAVDGVLGQDGTGQFYADVVLGQPQMWSWRLASTGDPTTAVEGYFWVPPSRVLP